MNTVTSCKCKVPSSWVWLFALTAVFSLGTWNLELGTVLAAPVSGEIAVAIFFEPVNQGQTKIDQINVDAETTLQLGLFISGVALRSTSVFSFKGAEFQAFEMHAGMVISFRNVVIFAPNILEIDDDPFWTIQFAQPDPGIVGVPLRMFIDELASPLDLAKLLAPTVDDPLQFRKLISQMGMNVFGVKFSITMLIANFGAVNQPDVQSGLIFEAGGVTLGGAEVISQTYIGARQGWECFGECKALERYFEGRVVPGFEFQEEKLIIRNLTLAGVTLGAELAFDFTTISLSQIILSGRVSVMGAVLQQKIVLNDLATPSFVSFGWTVQLGDGLFEIEFIDPNGAFQFPAKRLSFFVQWEAISFKDELVTQDPMGLLHTMEVLAEFEPFRFRSQTAFLGGLINGFYNQKLEMSWGMVGPGTWAWLATFEVQLRREYLLYISPAISVKF
ncbi:hypothetical protein HRbin07_00457 [bacterium HR07]|uniref:Uncharacterized protein n=1 Tax=Acetithermum autotrophicum TaxID=1446466 RepID=H5SSI9_ACEAU|nr:hypothetical protein HGMM_OP3C280 [Candidatus Acetothermum autotrophicum]GBC76258.1 hypothetical protein HRbin07_00457 [bacterium HR07]